MIANVIDATNTSYNVVKEIGEGSQGVTFLLEGGKHIAKLFKGSAKMDPTALKSKINFLINLGLDKRRYSVPLREITQPVIGYISEFATEMVPISALMLSDKVEYKVIWFVETGGLLKRYGVLIKLATELRNIHAKGLIYCDLSPNNVFISEKPAKVNVFLIDLDNLRYKTSIIHNIYTPRYGAPEVVRNDAPNSPMSDCFSFAVLAYELLTWAHPLFGDYVNDGEPELEDKAQRGELPWVEDEDDTSNERTNGVPSDVFVAKVIQKLFSRTFKDGLNDPFKRPTMGEWVEALNIALNELIKCPTCGIHYPFKTSGQCPFCEKSSETAFSLKIQRWDLDSFYDKETNKVEERYGLQERVYEEIMLDAVTPKYVKAFHLLIGTEESYDSPICQIKLAVDPQTEDVLLSVKPQDDFCFFYKYADGKSESSFDKDQVIRLKKGRTRKIVIGSNTFDNAQRVIVI